MRFIIHWTNLDDMNRIEREADQVVLLLDTLSTPESFLPTVDAARAAELSQILITPGTLADIGQFVARIVRTESL
jgi:hypothetical protein